ncbi:MAG: hypothetical protein ACRDV9_06015 [Acidimicrobiia bacterium]
MTNFSPLAPTDPLQSPYTIEPSYFATQVPSRFLFVLCHGDRPVRAYAHQYQADHDLAFFREEFGDGTGLRVLSIPYLP